MTDEKYQLTELQTTVNAGVTKSIRNGGNLVVTTNTTAQNNSCCTNNNVNMDRNKMADDEL